MTAVHTEFELRESRSMSSREDPLPLGPDLTQAQDFGNFLAPEEELSVSGEWVSIADDLDLSELADQVYEHCYRIALGKHFLDPVATEQLRHSIRQNVRNLHAILIGVGTVHEVSLTELQTFARLQAGLGIPQKDMQRSYRISYFLQWRAWRAHLAAHGAGPDVEAKLSRAVFTYQDFVANKVADVHGAFYDALSRSREHARRMLLRELTSGSLELTPSDRVLLGYDIDRHHRAVVLAESGDAVAESFARAIRSWRKDADVISRPFATRGTEVWVGLPAPWTVSADEDLVRLICGEGLQASLGEPGGGAAGFRRTHEMATDVQHLRSRYRGSVPQPLVIRHRDVQLELLLLRDEAGARDLVVRTLGPLAEDSEPALRLRETLLVWFRAGTLKAAAAELGYHEHTVRNRVLRAEELLGPSVPDRALELQVAVRLASYGPGSGLSAHDNAGGTHAD